MGQLILKRASASRPSGEWNDDDFDVLAGGVVVGRIFKANAAPLGSPWMWTLAFGRQNPAGATCVVASPNIPVHRSDDVSELPNRDPARNRH
jgi:hypothetical protein